MKFGDDWRGIYFRGDDAFGYACELRGHLAALETVRSPMATSGASHYLRRLADLLESTDERKPNEETQLMRAFVECRKP